jgi:ABC-type branched-subunit amino acid transport system ATPase component/ABC-type branched-subunit amino acid transport system permease subunit
MTTLATDLYLLVAAYGLAIAVSYAGLPVLGQGAFVAVGAFGTMQLAAHATPLGIAVLVAVAIAAGAGYLVGFAAARLAGAQLALATWALSWLAYTALVVFPRLSGGAQGLTRPTPARLVSPSLGLVVTIHPWVHVVIGAAVDVLLGVVLWRSAATAWGLDLAALRSGPVLADSLGVPVQRRRRAVLAVAAGLGAAGGAGTAVLLGVVAPVDYSPLLSLQLFVAVLVGGTATWWGPAVGVGLLAALPSTADAFATTFDVDPLRARAVLTAVLLVAAIATRGPVRRLVRRIGPKPTASATGEPPAESLPTPGPTPDAVLLRMRGVTAAYGAVVALDGVDLELRAGEIHALVGPNGSGKSTALRVAAGVVRAQHGEVVVGDWTAPARIDAAARVRAGVVRTLQRTAGLGDLDVRTQVAVGARACDGIAHLGVRELLHTRVAVRARDERSAIVTTSMQLVGLDDRATFSTVALDSAEQRLLQIARAAATGAPALLVDEPAAGMSEDQRRRLADILRRLTASGRGVLLVEHDMRLIGRVADRVTVLAEGRVLATGSPEQIRADPAVRRAYLGDPVP